MGVRVSEDEEWGGGALELCPGEEGALDCGITGVWGPWTPFAGSPSPTALTSLNP